MKTNSTRIGLGAGKGIGYKNLVPMDKYVHQLAGKGVKTYSKPTYIPTITGSLGSAQPKSKALEFRIWLHHRLGGDDTFRRFDTYSEAVEARKALMQNKAYIEVEPIIGVFRKDVAKYPEVKFWEARLK